MISHLLLWLFANLFIIYLLRLYSTSAEGQVLQPAKDVEFRIVCLKSCRQEKKSMMHQDSLEPAAIQFTLKVCRQSGYFLPVFFMHFLGNPRK